MVTQSNQGLYMPSGHLGLKGSVAPICGMLPGLPLRQELMTYASPSSWWGLLDEGSRQRLQAIITKMQKQGLLPCDHPTMMELCDAADSKLLAAILHNLHRVLHRLLPPVRESTYNLRQRPYDRTIPLITNIIFKKTFINRMVLKDSY